MTGYSRTSSTSDAPRGSADFVMISYPGADYLVNREEVISSLYHGGDERRGGNAVEAMAYHHRTIPLISLDDHLRLFYGEKSAQDSGVILFIRGSGGKAPFPRIRKKSDGGEIDTSVIAVRVSGMAGMLSIPLPELKPFPGDIRKGLAKYGLLGVRFPEQGRIQYFIDLKTIVILSIIHHHNRQARNENPDS